MDKLEETLISVKTWQDNYGEKIDNYGEKIDRYGEKIDAIHLLLHGNGEPEKGFVVRLIQLEGLARFGKRLGWLIGGVIVAGLVTMALQ